MAGGYDLQRVYALAWLFFGWAIALRNWLTDTSRHNQWLLVALFVAIFGGIYSIINLPLSYYSGFVLPHRFGQSNQSFKDWVIDQIKGLAVGAPLGLLLLELLYLALRVTGDLWWLWAAGGMLIFTVLLSNLAPILIMPLFNKYVPLGDEHKELAERLLASGEARKYKSTRRIQVRHVEADEICQRRADRHRQYASHCVGRYAHQRIFNG